MKQPKHILVIRLSAMGDVAMTVPVLRAFTSQYPDVKVTVLTRAFFAPFFDDMPNISVFHASVSGDHKGVFGLYKLSKELKNLNIDAIADLHNVLRSKILKTFLRKLPCAQIDKGRAAKKALVSGKIFEQLKTTHQRYANVFKQLGYPIDLSNPVFSEPKPISSKAQNIIGKTTQPWIGIAPFAQYESKMYGLDKMKIVIAALAKTNRIILFGGGEKEVEILEKFQNSIENTVNLAGKLSLKEELEVISNLDVMLSMDSGNAHIAAMLGIQVVTIWGVTHPYAGFSPFNQPKQNALIPDRIEFPLIPTSVYGNKFPESYKNVASSISEEKIIKTIETVLK